MRDRRPLIFLTAYFLVIFLWMWFCYRQVQKACLEAGHTLQGAVLEVEPFPEKDQSLKVREPKPFEKSKEAETGQAEAGEETAAPEESGTSQEETIRVVLLGPAGIYHEKILLEAGGEELTIGADSPYFSETGIIQIRVAKQGDTPITVTSLERACGHPSYAGALEIRKEEAGLVLINEVALEEYVKGVLPSEMPVSYPLEALKAQAVCARTYAEMKQLEKAYPQYDAAVDDSTACQVYRNLESSGQGDMAVEETAGEVLQKEDGSFAECYYYSTSCGRGAQMSVWHGGESKRPVPAVEKAEMDEINYDFFCFIREKNEDDPEVGEAFYRWQYRCEEAENEKIFARCITRQAVNDRLIYTESVEGGAEPGIESGQLGAIRDMGIAARQEGGVADCMKIVCEKGNVYVWGEYNIRYVLAQGGEVMLQNDATYQAKELLPSAFISLQSICNEEGNMVGYMVIGGGFGHGVGLSQNGAKQMALSGKGYREILETYYGL